MVRNSLFLIYGAAGLTTCLQMPILVIIVALFLAGCNRSSEPVDSTGLARCYENEFGTKVPPGVTVLQVKTVSVGDSEGRYYRLQTNHAMVESLVAGGFQATSKTEFEIMSKGGNTPEWWRPDDDLLLSFYKNPNWKGRRNKEGNSYAYIGVDSSERLAYVFVSVSY